MVTIGARGHTGALAQPQPRSHLTVFMTYIMHADFIID